MFGWLKKNARQADEEVEPGFSTVDLSGRLQRIVADQAARAAQSHHPIETPKATVFLMPPNHRRDFVGRYDWYRDAFFPFEG